MFNYREILGVIAGGIFASFCVWGAYRLLLSIIGYSLPFTSFQIELVSFLPIAIGITFTIFVITLLEKFFGSTQKTKQEVVDKIGFEEAKIRLQIAKEKDPDEKEELEEQALELRQEYEYLTSENLRKKDETFVEDWREVLLVTRKRLVYEEQRLLASNRVNLELAILTAFAGVALPLYYIIFGESAGTDSTFETFFASYWPIFSIVVIFEIIAIFFLRVYNHTAGRIERNKNEITNIELRLTSGLMLIDIVDKKNLKSLADDLAKEERNFVLGKNESSAILDTDKLLELLSKIPKIGN